jgi:hypothetical protein
MEKNLGRDPKFFPVATQKGDPVDKKCASIRIMLFERLGAKTVHSDLVF